MALLDGKTAIVTGGGGGIGRGIAERFAAKGAAVTVAEIDAVRAEETAAAIRARGGTVRPVVADVRDEMDVAHVVQACVEPHDGVDILVNNVGHYGGVRKPFHESTPDEWLELYRINLEHVLLSAVPCCGPWSSGSRASS